MSIPAPFPLLRQVPSAVRQTHSLSKAFLLINTHKSPFRSREPLNQLMRPVYFRNSCPGKTMCIYPLNQKMRNLEEWGILFFTAPQLSYFSVTNSTSWQITLLREFGFYVQRFLSILFSKWTLPIQNKGNVMELVLYHVGRVWRLIAWIVSVGYRIKRLLVFKKVPV